MLIDKYLPHFHFSEQHSISVRADATTIFSLVDKLDLSQSKVIRFLFWLRGMRSSKVHRQGMKSSGFIELERNLDDEIVIGLIGQFWRASGNLQKFEPIEFIRFNQSNFLKGVWNFRIIQKQTGCDVATETRVYATDDKSRKKFAVYWMFVKPFSGLIRKEILRTIKKSAELSAKEKL